MEKYIADKKVLALVEIADEKTPAGNKMISVNFVDGTQEEMPEIRFNLISSNEISDASTVQNKIRNHVGSYMLGVLHEFGIKMGEADMVLNSAGDLVNLAYEKARDIKWGGVSHSMLPLIEVNNVLAQNATKKDNDGAAPSGGKSD